MPGTGEPTTSPQSLAGVRVLDLSRVLAGPWCTQTLADLGADVIKVERPRGGDDTRGWGPPFLKGRDGADTGEAAYFLGTNRNKRSITIDIASPAGQALVRRLALRADVLVENFKVGDLARYGLDAARLRAENPRLVFCSITIDIASPAGQALVRRLALRADVLVENFKVGDLARYGLDATRLRDSRAPAHCHGAAGRAARRNRAAPPDRRSPKAAAAMP
jgi:crotonobetainyl-CoA:carnitine CoA-transferase CaiB-like acyl-CoA transferase